MPRSRPTTNSTSVPPAISATASAVTSAAARATIARNRRDPPQIDSHSDAPSNRFRLYEVAGMPQNNSRDNPGFLNDPCTLPVTDFPAGAFTALGLNYLVDWIASGKTPMHAPPIAVDDKTVVLDEYGNAKGGVRNVFVDVPIAANGVMGKGKTPAQDRLCQHAGTRVPLPDATIAKLYKNADGYQKRVNTRLAELVNEGWFLREYADEVRKDATAVQIK